MNKYILALLFDEHDEDQNDYDNRNRIYQKMLAKGLPSFEDCIKNIITPIFEKDNLTTDGWKFSELPVSDIDYIPSHERILSICLSHNDYREPLDLWITSDGDLLEVCINDYIMPKTIKEALPILKERNKMFNK